MRELRRAQALGQRQMAELAGVDAGLVCRIEAGQDPLSAATALRLARILGVAVFDLVPGAAFLRELHVDHARRCHERDAGELKAFELPGSIYVLLPPPLAKHVHALGAAV